MSSVFPWFAEALCLWRVYAGPVPESGRRGSFMPSHFTIWHLQEGGIRVDLDHETHHLRAPAWVLMPPRPREQSAEAASSYDFWGVTPWNYSHPYWENWSDVAWYQRVNERFLKS